MPSQDKVIDKFLKSDSGLELLQAIVLYEDVIYPQWKSQVKQLLMILQTNHTTQTLDVKQDDSYFQWKVQASMLMGTFSEKDYLEKYKTPTAQKDIEAAVAMISLLAKGTTFKIRADQLADPRLKEAVDGEDQKMSDELYDRMVPLVARAVGSALRQMEEKVIQVMTQTARLFVLKKEGKYVRVSDTCKGTPAECYLLCRDLYLTFLKADIPDVSDILTDGHNRTVRLWTTRYLPDDTDNWCVYCGGIGCPVQGDKWYCSERCRRLNEQ